MQDLLQDPVVCDDGYIYGRAAIMQWLRYNKTSPVTRMPLSSTRLQPCYPLRSAAMEWQRGSQARSVAVMLIMPLRVCVSGTTESGDIVLEVLRLGPSQLQLLQHAQYGRWVTSSYLTASLSVPRKIL